MIPFNVNKQICHCKIFYASGPIDKIYCYIVTFSLYASNN